MANSGPSVSVDRWSSSCDWMACLVYSSTRSTTHEAGVRAYVRGSVRREGEGGGDRCVWSRLEHQVKVSKR